jgi:hypothetical protein
MKHFYLLLFFALDLAAAAQDTIVLLDAKTIICKVI